MRYTTPMLISAPTTVTSYAVFAWAIPSRLTRAVMSITPAKGTTANPIIAGSMISPGAIVNRALSTPSGV